VSFLHLLWSPIVFCVLAVTSAIWVYNRAARAAIQRVRQHIPPGSPASTGVYCQWRARRDEMLDIWTATRTRQGWRIRLRYEPNEKRLMYRQWPRENEGDGQSEPIEWRVTRGRVVPANDVARQMETLLRGGKM
jgi:hypothetical protein